MNWPVPAAWANSPPLCGVTQLFVKLTGWIYWLNSIGVANSTKAVNKQQYSSVSASHTWKQYGFGIKLDYKPISWLIVSSSYNGWMYWLKNGTMDLCENWPTDMLPRYTVISSWWAMQCAAVKIHLSTQQKYDKIDTKKSIVALLKLTGLIVMMHRTDYRHHPRTRRRGNYCIRSSSHW